MIRHLGVFQFKPEITEEEIKHCFAELCAMVGQVPGLLKVEHGPHQSDEGLEDGFTHAFCMTFDSFESRDAYLPHPVHQERVALIQPKLERLVVLDFEVKPEQSASV